MALKDDAMIVAGVGVALIALIWYAKKKVLDDLLPKIDPTSDKNLAYQASSALARWLAGQEEGTVGTIAWDYIHKAEPMPGGDGALINYTEAQRAYDEAAMRRLERGYHGM